MKMEIYTGRNPTLRLELDRTPMPQNLPKFKQFILDLFYELYDMGEADEPEEEEV